MMAADDSNLPEWTAEDIGEEAKEAGQFAVSNEMLETRKLQKLNLQELLQTFQIADIDIHATVCHDKHIFSNTQENAQLV